MTRMETETVNASTEQPKSAWSEMTGGAKDADALLEVRDVCKVFPGERTVVALDRVTLNVKRGEFVCLVGPSGCGKTTLLRIIDGIDIADQGAIFLDGQRVSGVSRDMAYVFQDINLLPWRSVLENVALGLEVRKIPKQQRVARALEVLEMVGLAEVAKSPPYTLSGGMQQRVGVARALAVEPKVFLMDEPFGQLDNFTREALQVEIANLWSRLGATIVFVTHDVDEAIFLGDRIALFQANPGRITEIVDVDLPRPRTDYDVLANKHAIELRAHITKHLGAGRLETR